MRRFSATRLTDAEPFSSFIWGVPLLDVGSGGRREPESLRCFPHADAGERGRWVQKFSMTPKMPARASPFLADPSVPLPLSNFAYQTDPMRSTPSVRV